MFFIRKPSDRAIKEFLARARTSQRTYDPVGLSLMSPARFHVDELRFKIGEGSEAFERARQAIDSWKPLKIAWVEPHPATVAPEVDGDVAVMANHAGFWSLNACRVVMRFPTSAEDRRYGFAYGTLADHAESGEELFAVELDDADGTVWYQIRAVSRPRAFLAKAGHPISRQLQRRFREESARAMAVAIQN
jgi:uncharacterized protein (UPF0548 family)